MQSICIPLARFRTSRLLQALRGAVSQNARGSSSWVMTTSLACYGPSAPTAQKYGYIASAVLTQQRKSQLGQILGEKFKFYISSIQWIIVTLVVFWRYSLNICNNWQWVTCGTCGDSEGGQKQLDSQLGPLQSHTNNLWKFKYKPLSLSMIQNEIWFLSTWWPIRSGQWDCDKRRVHLLSQKKN